MELLIIRIKQIIITWFRRAKPLLIRSSIYSRTIPSHQEALNLFEGEWTSRIPGYVSGGEALLFTEDIRPGWADREAGGIANKNVLELGSLEGGHSYQLENLGANVTAIEGNKLAFQRSLIVKNIFNWRTTFLLGDFISYLQTTDEKYDLVFASGVLYHMQNPVEVLKNICRITDYVFLWTHYYDEEALLKNPRVAKTFGSKVQKTQYIRDIPIYLLRA